MGTVYKISCECGYSKNLKLGCGLSSRDIDVVNRLFSEKELRKFNKYYKDGKVKKFGLQSVAALCKKCGEIEEVNKLNVELSNGKKISLISKCPVCGEEVATLNNKYICPKCNKNMKLETSGLWD